MIMTRHIPQSALLGALLDTVFGALIPAVEELVERVTGVESTVIQASAAGVECASGTDFPDGVGRGQLVARLFRYRDAVRVDVKLVHNRSFANRDGTPSDRRCFLNDFVASVTLPAGAAALPPGFVHRVVAGVAAARDAVQRHNRRHQAPWHELRIAAGEPAYALHG